MKSSTKPKCKKYCGYVVCGLTYDTLKLADLFKNLITKFITILTKPQYLFKSLWKPLQIIYF